MRITTMLLGLFGCAGALFAFGQVMYLIDGIRYIDTPKELLKTVYLAVLFLSGYWIWFGWLLYTFKQRFPWVSPRTFWIVSLVHHTVWLLLMIPEDVWGGGDDPWLVPAWLIANLVIATVFVFRCKSNEDMPNEESDPQSEQPES